MSEALLFPQVPVPAPHPRTGPGGLDRPAPARTPVIDRLRWADGRRVLVTSGRLDARDLAELKRAARFGSIEVRIRIPTPDRRLAGVLEPGAPPPALRFATLRLARRAGLTAGIVAGPLVPGVTANERDLVTLFAAARAAGAAFLMPEVAIPRAARQADLVTRLRRAYPRVAARFEVWRRTSRLAAEEERDRILELAGELGRRFGLPAEPGGARDPEHPGGQSRFAFAS
jgi:DNA repair photolyase